GGVKRRSPGRSGDLSEGQTDGQHQEWSDLVSDERFESTVTYLQVRQRVGLRHLDAQPRREHVVETGDARTAAARVQRAQIGRPGILREKCRRALDTDRDLFTACLEHRIEMRRAIEALDEMLRRVGREAALAL